MVPVLYILIKQGSDRFFPPQKHMDDDELEETFPTPAKTH
jgi:hypothetical protein